MVKTCYFCKKSFDKEQKITFHQLPSDDGLRRQWLNAIGTEDNPSKFTCICSLHFKADDFNLDHFCKGRKLKKNAIPSIFSSQSEPTKYPSPSAEPVPEPTKYPSPSAEPVPVQTFPNCDDDNQDNLCPDTTIPKIFEFKRFGTLSPQFDYGVKKRCRPAEENCVEKHLPKIFQFKRIRRSPSPVLPVVTGVRHRCKKRGQCKMFSGKDVSNIYQSRKSKAVQTDVSLEVHPEVLRLKKKINNLKKKDSRLKFKVENMKGMILQLKKKRLWNPSLETGFKGLTGELMNNLIRNSNIPKRQRRYADGLKEFAMTLYFYSPKAYNFVRNHIPLPNKSLLGKWARSVNGEPGQLSGVLKYLEENVEMKPYLKNMALMFDGMAIRKQLIYDTTHGEMIGCVNLGHIQPKDAEALASEALVFMIVSYTIPFKVPVAYYFTDKDVSAEVLARMIIMIIRELYSSGVNIRSVTSDGPGTNLAAYKILGCEFDHEIKPFFLHPISKEIISVFLDAAHMVKLARNTLADVKNITCRDGPIKWEYIVALNELQDELELKFANKLSGKHIKFRNKVMSVSIAAQTLSSGVADALGYLLKSGHPTFENCEGTISFLRHIDRLFDTLNSRSICGKGYKGALTPKNLNYTRKYLDDTYEFIKSIKVNGESILTHRRKTFAVGFLGDIKSVLQLAETLFTLDVYNLRYFLVYKVSQDHLELLFNCIRSQNGRNDNPNVVQFKSALKKILLRNYITPTDNGNCSADVDSGVSGIFRFTTTNTKANNDADSQEEAKLRQWLAMTDDHSSEYFNYLKNILYYIAGYIVFKMLKTVKCTDCVALLKAVPPKTVDNDHTYAKTEPAIVSGFTKITTRGGLKLASDWVFEIVELTEKTIRSLSVHEKDLKRKIVTKVCMELHNKNLPVSHPIVSRFAEDSHPFTLQKQIIDLYVSLRLHSSAKKFTEVTQGNKATIRQRLTKIIQWENV